jgi:flagellar motor switch protein FliG
MSANAQAKMAVPALSLTGAEKVTVLLLALGKPRAAKLLKLFDPDDLKVLTQLAGDLQPIGATDLEMLVEEFAQKFASGVNFVGTEKEVKSLLSDVMVDDPMAGMMPEMSEVPASEGTDALIWEKVSQLKTEVLSAFLENEHPQTVAVILSKIDPAVAAKMIKAYPPQQRNELLCRMLGIKQVSDEAARAVEAAITEQLLTNVSSGSHTSVADILNQLEKPHSDEMLKKLAEVRPEDAQVLKSMLFTFEELTKLSDKSRTMLLDQVPTERLIAALKGMDAAFQAAILSSLGARSRRMVEAELASGGTATPREIVEARKAIVDVVLKMMQKGEILLKEPDPLDDLTVAESA